MVVVIGVVLVVVTGVATVVVTRAMVAVVGVVLEEAAWSPWSVAERHGLFRVGASTTGGNGLECIDHVMVKMVRREKERGNTRRMH